MRRTLVLSLLRAGDTLVHLPALAALRAADPGGELHVLVQAAARPAIALLATQATVHPLPVDHQGGPLGPCAALVEELRARDFDLVVNLTHRLFAADLAAAVGGRRQLGLVRRDGAPAVSSPWLAALNDWGTSAALSVLHYADVACQALGVPRADPDLVARLPPAVEDWWRTARARLGLDAGAPLPGPGRPLVALQLTTSEPKKTWPAARWAAFARELRARVPEVALVALASPAEEAAVAAALAGTGAGVLACTLPEAARLLADAALLVTGDTALVHLGALAGAPVMLLSSGSSAFRELGPAGAGHLVLQAAWPCAPCAHDPGCLASARGHPCVEAVEPAYAAAVAHATLAGGAPPEPAPGGRVALFRSALDARGLVTYHPVGWAPPDTASAELLRAHLLERLPVAAAGSSAPEAPRPAGPHERAALADLDAAAAALRARAEGRDAGALGRLLPTLQSPFALAFASAVAARLRDGDGAALAEELARLRRRIAAAA
ncbi:MAG TPA: glycosyltransferase family 9 protein [Anaeromyxobacter sp.]|nr:glycosyltransferase family 9 protein [Anaeromyxobacter sp.]